MEPVNNNLFEVKPTAKSKRKITTPSGNVYLNPALDLLANDDPMCNTAMEIVPNKKRRRTRSCDIVAFENTALDLGISKAMVNEFLVRELDNVRKNVKNEYLVNNSDTTTDTDVADAVEESIYANLTETELMQNNDKVEICKFQTDVSDVEMDSGISVLESKSLNVVPNEFENTTTLPDGYNTNIQTNITNQIFINNKSDLSLSFIDRLALDSPNLSNQSLYLDDDLNESNIMEIKTITIITKKKRVPDRMTNTNPFLDPNLNVNVEMSSENPFLTNTINPELEYNEEILNRPIQHPIPQINPLMPRRLFTNDTNSTISTVNESEFDNQHEYENIDSYRSESPIYENIGEEALNDTAYNKQSKILGCDVSQFSAVDIMNLNKVSNQSNSSNDSNNDSKKDLRHQFLKVSNKLSKKVLKKLKKTFKPEKIDHNATLNPYEVPRKPPKQKIAPKEAGIENPALNIDNSDEIEIEELDDEEHQYETIKTLRNTRLNMNVTPLRERCNENMDVSHKSNTPGKKVRFDSTLNQEKVITGNSFDCDVQSPGFDAKIDKYHDELENCINEKKFLQQNM